MIVSEIYLEGYKLDLVQDLQTEFSYAIDDIADFGSKNTSYSKTISLTGTSNNNAIFGFVFDLGNSNFTDNTLPNVGYNFNASKTAQCKIFINRIQIFKGVLRLLEIVKDGEVIEYQCSVFGDLGGFISALGNKKIEELDFSDYDEDWDATNITTSWDNIDGSGVYYPLIDTGGVSINKIDFEYRAFKPALYVKEYLQKIISTSGYTWDFPLLSTTLFNKLIVSCNQKILSNVSTKAFNATANQTTYNTNNYPAFTPTIAGQFVASGSAWQYTGIDPLIGVITLQLNGNILDVFPDPAPVTLVTISLQINGSDVDSQQFAVYTEPTSFYVNFQYNFTLNTNNTINAFVTSNATSYNITSGILSFDTNSSVQVPVNYGEALSINNAIPKGIFQRDFFLTICKMFNLYVYDDQYQTKKLIVKPYIQFYEGDTLDWTNKIDRSKPMSIKPMSEINARYYQFKYAQDNDYYNENYRKKYSEGYADRIFDTEFDFVKETDSQSIIFASTILFQKATTDKIYSSIYKLSNNNTAEDPMDYVIRILQAKKINGRANWKILNNTIDVSGNLNSYGYAGHLDDPFTPTNDLNFGAPKEIYFDATTYPTTNLFNAYYSDYMAEITDKDSKLLSCNVYLNEVDILNLDLSKLIWIDGILFRLNNVDGYNPIGNQTTKVRLLKVINNTF
jgi:hypothetical protein